MSREPQPNKAIINLVAFILHFTIYYDILIARLVLGMRTPFYMVANISLFQNLEGEKLNMKKDLKELKYFSDLEYNNAWNYSFYLAPRAYEMLQQLKDKGEGISRAINTAIWEYYKRRS